MKLETFQTVLNEVHKVLSESSEISQRGSDQVEAEQIVLAAHRLMSNQVISRMDLYRSLGALFPGDAHRVALDWAQRRAAGEVLQYLTGSQFFFGREYRVGPGVLVPRPETEVLVQEAIQYFCDRSTQPQVGIEIGLGSGILSLELLHHFSGLKMVASEVSSQAIQYASANFEKSGLSAERLQVVSPLPNEVFQPFWEVFENRKADFLISNPPYLIEGDSIQRDVLNHEPHLALFSKQGDPFFFYREIAERGKWILQKSAPVFLEVPCERAREIEELFTHHSWNTRVVQDLRGDDRVLIANQTEEVLS